MFRNTHHTRATIFYVTSNKAKQSYIMTESTTSVLLTREFFLM